MCGDSAGATTDGAIILCAEGIKDGSGVTFLLICMVIVAQMGKFVGKRLEDLLPWKGNSLSFHPLFAANIDYLVSGKSDGPTLAITCTPDPLFFPYIMAPRPNAKGHCKSRHLLLGLAKISFNKVEVGRYLGPVKDHLSFYDSHGPY